MICYTKMKDSMRCFFFYPTFTDFVFYKRSKDLWGNDPIMGLVMSVYSVQPHLYRIFGCPQVIVQGHHRKICCCHWRIDSGRTVFLPSNHWIFPWYQLPQVHTPFDAADLGSDSTIPRSTAAVHGPSAPGSMDHRVD